jgi:hypothetical protein
VTQIQAGASLAVKVSITQYENLSPFFSGGWTEEVPDDWTDEQKLARIKEIQVKCRAALEELIDEDVNDLAGIRVFMQLDKQGNRTYKKEKE